MNSVLKCRPNGSCRYSLVAIATIVLTGCGSDLNLAPVNGVVQREGQPVSGGKVVFLPVGGGLPAHGAIEQDGSFEMTTESNGDGALVGSHRVTIVGDRSASEEDARLTYVPPRDYTIDVLAEQDNNITINVSKDDGWQVQTDD